MLIAGLILNIEIIAFQIEGFSSFISLRVCAAILKYLKPVPSRV